MVPVKKYFTTSIVSRLSTVEAGTLYEEYVLKTLTAYGFALNRCGGPNDKGIDLSGYVKDVPVIVQCKHYEAHLTPSVLRELYGVIAARPNHFGLLVCSAGVKEGSLSFLQSATLPMGIMALLTAAEAPHPTSLIMNRPARRMLSFLRQASVYYRDRDGSHVKGIELQIT